MKRVVRAVTQRLRGVPKRRLLELTPDDAVFMAGFYEATDAASQLFPHWHGFIALNAGEEPLLRDVLSERGVKDNTPGHATASGVIASDRNLISTPQAKPSFDLRPLTTPKHFIRYANKKVSGGDSTHWTTNDFIQ
jgi:hypothetical protein